MLQDLLRVAMPVAVIVALTFVGYAATTLLDRRRWEFLTPALPAVGLIVTVVALHWTTLLMGTDQGIWIVLAAALVVVLVTARRNPSRLRIRRDALCALAVALLLGVPTLLIAAQPAFRIDDASVVHPSGNHDSFFFVSDAAWLRDHTGLQRPSLGPTPSTSVDVPADQPAIATVKFGFRLGEPLVQASVASISGKSLASFWYEVTTGWMVLMPGATIALASCLRLRRWIGATAGLAASVSTLALFQVLNQNGPSVMAGAILPLVIGLVIRATDDAAGREWTDVVVAAVGMGAFFGTYPEISSLIGLPVIALLLTARFGWRERIKRAAVFAAATLVISPLAVYNAARLLRTLSSITSEWPRRAFTSGAGVAIAHGTGSEGINEPVVRTGIALIVLAIVLAGLSCAAFVLRLRVFVAGLVISGVLTFTSQYRQHDDYSMERLVMVGQPIVLWCAFLGLGAAVCYLFAAKERWPHASALRTAGAVLALSALTFTLWVQITTQLRITPGLTDLRSLSVRPEVVEAIRWAEDRGGTNGSDVTVLTDDYNDRLWLTDGLRERRDVSYPYLTGDYFGITSFTDGQLTRYLVASRNVFTDAPDAAIVESNDRYVMYDLATVEAWFALPTNGVYGLERQPGGTAGTWVGAAAELVVMRTSPTVAITLQAAANPNLPGLSISVSIDGVVLGEAPVSTTQAPLALPLDPSILVATVAVTPNVGPIPLSDLDQRLTTFSLASMTTG